jgi:hypothetical protein
VRSQDFLNLSLPSILWKHLASEQTNLSDLEAVDLSFTKSMESFRKIEDEGVTRETFSDVIFETFETLSVDDRKVDLVPNGSSVDVTWDNREE